MLRKEK